MRLSITDECYEFYALSELRGYLEDRRYNGPYRFYVERMYQRHVERFAEQIFDYLTVVSFGESLHSIGRCDTRGINYDLKDFQGNTRDILVSYPGTRTTVYNQHAKYFDKHKLLEGIEEIFMKGRWKDGFGGESWGKIARLALRYLNGDISPTLFIDYSINLHHNGGNVFNKPYLFFDFERLVKFLNYRKFAKSVFDVMSWNLTHQAVSIDLYNLLLAWHFYDVFPDYHTPVIKEYPVLSGWGNIELEVEEKERADEDYEDEDEEEEYEADEDSIIQLEKPVKKAVLPSLLCDGHWNEYMPAGTPLSKAAGFIKGYLLAHPKEWAGSGVAIAYESPSTIHDGENSTKFTITENGYGVNCSCYQCHAKTIYMLSKYEPAFHDHLKNGGKPETFKQAPKEAVFEKVIGTYEEFLSGKITSTAVYNPKAVLSKDAYLGPPLKLKGVV